RLELSELLQQNRVMSLKNNIIQQLLPDTQKTDQPELIGSKYEKEWIVVSPGYRMDEDAIRMELDRRGLIPANTEDGLGFMLTHQRATVENSLVVLDSWREYRGSKEFLALGYTGAGFPMVFMTSNVEADKYLAKAKPLQPAASEPEN
ncbi:MAG: hypothetical protein P4L61_00995, partial [Candidatus Pacebacteria bacterium]|nr:hypothetical protein [Candidatus Paceibacterota bacterium]